MLLQDGHSTQTPPTAGRNDWWAMCTEIELAGPCWVEPADQPASAAALGAHVATEGPVLGCDPASTSLGLNSSPHTAATTPNANGGPATPTAGSHIVSPTPAAPLSGTTTAPLVAAFIESIRLSLQEPLISSPPRA